MAQGPAFKPGQAVKPAPAANVNPYYNKVVQVLHADIFLAYGDPITYACLCTDNTVVRLTEAQLQAK